MEWLVAVLIPVIAAIVGWLLKRAFVSVIDERVMPEVKGIRTEMVSMNGANSRAHAELQAQISKSNERIAHIEGPR